MIAMRRRLGDRRENASQSKQFLMSGAWDERSGELASSVVCAILSERVGCNVRIDIGFEKYQLY